MGSASPVFFVVAAVAIVSVAKAECEYESITEQQGGSSTVAVVVKHSFDVPPADDRCPEGYGGVIFEMSAEGRSIQALFLDILDSYEHFENLGDLEPSVVSSDQDVVLENVYFAKGEVENVGGVQSETTGGAFDLGMTFGDGDCSKPYSQALSVEIVGCGFTMEHLAHQKMSVALACVEKNSSTNSASSDSDVEVATLGFGGAVPDSCDIDEVLNASVEASGDPAVDDTTEGTTDGGDFGTFHGDSTVTSSTDGSDVSAGNGDINSYGASAAGICTELLNVIEAAGTEAFLAIREEFPLPFETSSEDCEFRTVRVTLDTWAGSSPKAAFFDLEDNDYDLSGLELSATLVYPSDGSVEISSEKVSDGEMSAIDGYESGSRGFDFAIGFEGESDVIGLDLTGCGLTVESFVGNRATIVATDNDNGNTYTLVESNVDCIVEEASGTPPTPAPTFLPAATPAPGSTLAPGTTHAPGVTLAPGTTLSPSQTEFPQSTAPSQSPSTSTMSPTAVPIAAPTATPTPVADLGGTVSGSLSISGVDPATEDEEVYEAAREGLAEAFGLPDVSSVSVGAPGTLLGSTGSGGDDDLVDGYGDDYSGDDVAEETVTGGSGDSHQRGRRRRASETRLPTWQISSRDARDDSANLRHQQYYLVGAAGVSPQYGDGYGVPRYRSRRRRRGRRRRRRGLQEDEGSGETVDMDFEVLLPADGGEGAASPAARVAAVLNEYADDTDGWAVTLADSLGVVREDVSLFSLTFCTGSSSNDCGNVSTVVTTQNVVDELGTSGPWENFMLNGGFLMITLFGTLCLCFCLAAMCYHLLFNGEAYENVEILKPVSSVSDVPANRSGPSSASKEREEMSLYPTGLFERSGISSLPDRRPRVFYDEKQPGIGLTGRVDDSKEGEHVEVGYRMASPATSRTTVSSAHWTASHFGRKASSEYDLQNPLRGTTMDFAEVNRRFGDMVVVQSPSEPHPTWVGHFGQNRLEGDFKTTNPMFLGRDTGSRSPSPREMASSLFTKSTSPGMTSNNPLFGLASSSSVLSASAAAGAGGAVRRSALAGTRSPPLTGVVGNSSSSSSSSNGLAYTQGESQAVVLSKRGASTTDGSEESGGTLSGDGLPDHFAYRGPSSAGSSATAAVVALYPAQASESTGGRSRGAASAGPQPGGPQPGGIASTSPSGSPAIMTGSLSPGPAASPKGVQSSGNNELPDDAAASAWLPARAATSRPSNLPPSSSQQSALAGGGGGGAETEGGGVAEVGSTASAIATVERRQQQGKEGAGSAAAEEEVETGNVQRGSGGALSSWRNTLLQGLLGSRNRTQGTGATSLPSSHSRQHRRHQSATARWSAGPDTLTPSEPGTGSISSSSTSTRHIAADVLSHPRTVSAESDFSLSDVFAGAVSPAGLAAAAAAASSREDLVVFRTGGTARTGGAGGSTARTLTPRARPGGGKLGGRSPSSPIIGRVVAAVAEAAAETAAEEEAAKLGVEREADEPGGAAWGDSSPPPISAMGEDENEESPPKMQGLSMLGRLSSPQELSPTTPTEGDAVTALLADTEALSGGKVGTAAGAEVGVVPGIATVSDDRTVPGRLGLTLSSPYEVSPSRAILSPGTDSDPGSTPSPELLVRRSGRLFGGGPPTREGFSPQPEGAASHAEEEMPGIDARPVSTTSTFRPPPEEALTVSVSPRSAATAGSSLWPAASHTIPTSAGWQGADEVPGGLLATRSSKMRALGTLDLMQVVGTFSDSGSSSEIEETSPRARAASASNFPRPKSPRAKSPRLKVLPVVGPGTGRPSSPINTTQQQEQQQAPSPLPPIQTDPERIAGVHFHEAASPTPGESPGVESSREYSESDDDDTPGGGMLKGEDLVS